MGPVSETDPDEPTPVLVEDEAPEETSSYQRFDCTDSTADHFLATDAARQAIEAGDCIVLPTDTVYGIGADAFSRRRGATAARRQESRPRHASAGADRRVER